MLEPHSHRRPLDSSSVYSHSRSRTTSSNTFPVQQPTPMHLHQPYGQPQQQSFTRRSPSINTFSTTSTVPPPAAYRTSPTNDLRRSTSSRSGGAPAQATGYVALLRKQKATVWCDRSQYEDPRLLAAQRAAKLRANMEMVGGQRTASGSSGPSGRTTTGISATGKVAAKIRHHGKPGVVGYAPGENHIGVGGVPMRLSATEVEAESSDDDDAAAAAASRLHHRRTGSSGRSSTASRRGLTYRTSGASNGPKWSPGDTPERTGSIVEERPGGEQVLGDAASEKARSMASGSSGERADAVGELGGGSNPAARLASNSLMNATVTREKSVKTVDELRRRGSVDERTSSLNTTGRLYIANPD